MLKTHKSFRTKSSNIKFIKSTRFHPKNITINSNIMDGIPVIKGTRIPVYIILEFIERGYSYNQIIKEYPSLSVKDIHNAIKFASALTAIH